MGEPPLQLEDDPHGDAAGAVAQPAYDPDALGRVAAGVGVSLVAHGVVGLLLIAGPSVAGEVASAVDGPRSRQPEAPATPDRPPPLGIDGSRAVTINWLGFDEPAPGRAIEADTSQAAFAEAGGGEPLDPGPVSEPSAPAEASAASEPAPQAQPVVEPAPRPVTEVATDSAAESVSESVSESGAVGGAEGAAEAGLDVGPVAPTSGDETAEPIAPVEGLRVIESGATEALRALGESGVVVTPEAQAAAAIESAPRPEKAESAEQPELVDGGARPALSPGAASEVALPDAAAGAQPTPTTPPQPTTQAQPTTPPQPTTQAAPATPPQPQSPARPATAPPAQAPGPGASDRPVVGEPSDRESTPTAPIANLELNQWARPIAGPGIEIKTVNPHLSLTTRLLTRSLLASVEITFGVDGKPRDVKFRNDERGRPITTGSIARDQDLLDAVLRWRASGEKIEELRRQLGPEGEFRIVVNLRAL